MYNRPFVDTSLTSHQSCDAKTDFSSKPQLNGSNSHVLHDGPESYASYASYASTYQNKGQNPFYIEKNYQTCLTEQNKEQPASSLLYVSQSSDSETRNVCETKSAKSAKSVQSVRSMLKHPYDINANIDVINRPIKTEPNLSKILVKKNVVNQKISSSNKYCLQNENNGPPSDGASEIVSSGEYLPVCEKQPIYNDTMEQIPQIKTLTGPSDNRIGQGRIPRPEYKGPSEAQLKAGSRIFETDKYGLPPPANTIYTCIDKGSASCRFMRLTLNYMPARVHTLSTCQIPFVTIVQPFADIEENEEPIPIVDLNNHISQDKTAELPRCPRCKAYVNPFMSWSSEGKKCMCNLCDHGFALPADYVRAIDEYGLRAQHGDQTYDRPELMKGTIDYKAPPALSIDKNENTKLPCYCFAIEIRKTCFFEAVLQAIAESLESFPTDSCEMCLVAYDGTKIYYHSFSEINLQKNPELLIMTDFSDLFYPAPSDNLCIIVKENIPRILLALQNLLTICNENEGGTNPPTFITQKAVIQSTQLLLGERAGGIILLFSHGECQYNSINNNSFKQNIIQSDNIIQSNKYSTNMSLQRFISNKKHCEISSESERKKRAQKEAENIITIGNEKGISFEIFYFPHITPPPGESSFHFLFCNLISTQTGGHVHYERNLNLTFEDKKEFIKEHIKRCLLRTTAIKCTFKIRTSVGLSVSSCIGPLFLNKQAMSDPAFFKIGRIDSDTSFAFTINHEDQLVSSRQAFLQCAILYSTMEGLKYLRVHTLAVPLTSSLSSCFRYTELETLVNYLARVAASLALQDSAATITETLTESVVKILAAYRSSCAINSSTGQLILPDALKHLPLYLSAILKHMAFRGGSHLGADERNFWLYKFLTLPVPHCCTTLYPRLYPIHHSYTSSDAERRNYAKVGQDTGYNGHIFLPKSIPTTGQCIYSDGVYLCEAGYVLLLYIGSAVKPEYLMELFGTDNLLPSESLTLQSEFVGRIIKQVRRDRGSHPFMPLRIIPSVSPADECKFRAYLVEDKLSAEVSYPDFLCILHRMVHMKLDESL